MDSSYTYGSTTSGSAADNGLVVLVWMFLMLIGYVVGSWVLGRLFKKAGRPAWEAWVPFLNNWRFFEIGDQHGALSLLGLIPGVNIAALIISILAAGNIGRHLGHGTGYTVLYFFLSPIWLIILAFNHDTWDNQAPAGAVPVMPVQPPVTPDNQLPPTPPTQG